MKKSSHPPLRRKAVLTAGLRFGLRTAAILGCLAATYSGACAAERSTEAPATITFVAEEADLQRQFDNLQQQIAALGQRLEQQAATPLPLTTLIMPGVTSNLPSAYGAGKGTVGIGFGYQERTRYSNRDDGTVGLVVGLGDPARFGFDVQVTALDLSRFGRRAGLSIKAHRLLANDYTVAVGVENLLTRNRADSGRSLYAVLGKNIRLKENGSKAFSRLYLTAGIGSGRFRSERNFLNDTGSINVFGSAAINLNASSTIFTEWTGQGLNIGASIVPFKNLPLVITPALADIAGPAGDGTRFILGVGYIIR